MEFIAVLVLWVAVGTAGFRWWWKRDTVGLGETPAMFSILIGGLLGPFAWLAGWMIHGR